MTQSVSVIVPVFNAADDLNRCLARLSKFAPIGWSVHLVDDASTESAVSDVLRAHQQQNPHWHVRRRRENLGFVAGCNEALQHIAPTHDVLLLNTDTLPTPCSMINMALTLQSCPDAATVTPWSNNAEICSLPELCKAAPIPTDPDLVSFRIAPLEPSYPELPTGVGFCMLIRRTAILDCGGLFDEQSFPRGYGEENDFCRRAVAAGYTNRLCDNAYVPHVGGASFGPLGLYPDRQAMDRLLAKHPDYQDCVSSFIDSDPLAALRARITTHLNGLLWSAA